MNELDIAPYPGTRVLPAATDIKFGDVVYIDDDGHFAPYRLSNASQDAWGVAIHAAKKGERLTANRVSTDS